LPTIAGIDEAGYSPLLGPLVVTAAGFEAQAMPNDWWAELGIPKANESRDDASPPAVDDSKKLYTPARGVARLEQAVLAFLKTTGSEPATLRELLACIGAKVDVQAYPWYRDADVALPIAAEPETIERAAAALRRAFADAGVGFAGFHCRPLLVGDFNGRVQSCGNKAHVLFRSALDAACHFHGRSRAVQVLADKQGGRNYYGRLLSQYFFGARVAARIEGKAMSSYRVEHDGGELDISFWLKGDAAHLPIALASMCSKYVRELFLVMFNRYWQALRPGIGRTCGYQVDGRRFVRAISDLPEFGEVSRRLIIREK
jgi:ribonuclease HII